jgi:hypothetical protein
MKKNTLKSSVIILVILLFPAIFAMAGPAPVNAEQAADKVKAVVVAETSADRTDPQTLGCILPLTGRFAAYGNRALETITLAERLHARGGTDWASYAAILACERAPAR